MASTLLACLELARDGKVEIQQASPFAEIYVRDRERAPDTNGDTVASPN